QVRAGTSSLRRAQMLPSERWSHASVVPRTDSSCTLPRLSQRKEVSACGNVRNALRAILIRRFRADSAQAAEPPSGWLGYTVAMTLTCRLLNSVELNSKQGLSHRYPPPTDSSSPTANLPSATRSQ